MRSHESKLKILMLGYNDNRMAGHMYLTFEKQPDCYEKRLVVFNTLYHDHERSFFDLEQKPGLREKIRRSMFRKVQRYRRRFHAGEDVKVDQGRQEYCFFGNDFVPITAEAILKKCDGFVPDVISIHWVAGFVTSDTVRRLHELTGARIVFFFVDEAHMTGGCHYPVDCKGYLEDCLNCPALQKGKKLAAVQLQRKKENYKNLPITVMATPYDCRLAQQSPLFKDASYIQLVNMPQLPAYSRTEARAKFRIPEGDFVVLMGANYLYETRKGVKYSAEAIRMFAAAHENVCVLLPGNNAAGNELDFGNAKVVYTGFLSMDDLCAAYCAADCFLSTTIADSGPMMVNFSIIEGIPVVAFDLGIAQDLVLHKRTGYIAQYKDSKDVANGLEFIYNSDGEQFREECRKLVQKHRNRPSPFEELYRLCTTK